MANGVWTNNWQSLINTMLMTATYPGMSTLVNTSGNTITKKNNYTGRSPMSVYQNGPIAAYQTHIEVGTSSTTPAASDYYLGQAPSDLSYLSCLNAEFNEDLANGTLTRVVKQTVQYQGQTSITLREWGIFVWVFSSGYGYAPTSNGANIMIYHELFDSPVTLLPYQSATIELTLVLTLSNPV